MNVPRSPLLTPPNLIALSTLLASSFWLSWWFYDRSQYVYVTDARVASSMINVSSRIPGWIVEFPLSEGQHVNKGDALAMIDSRDIKLQLSEVEARLSTLQYEYEKKELQLALSIKQVDSSIKAEQARLAAAQAGLAEASIELSQAKKDLKRAKSLLKQKMISDEVFEARQRDSDRAVEAHHRREAELATANAQLQAAQANLASIDVLNKELEIARNREVEMEVEHSRFSNLLADHMISSSIAGVVDETFINSGEYVYPGQRILMLHDPNKVWIKANVKETDIRRIAIGSPVSIAVDAFPGTTLKGKVSNIGSSATSQFAMLPSPNPSGNFTKVTQRLEVRIELEAVGLDLKPGMMVELRIPVTNS